MWRGPKKNSIIKQFVENVSWGDLDVLIVDTPPGTSDEHLRFPNTKPILSQLLLASARHHRLRRSPVVLSVVESLAGLALDGALLVTTPQVK